MDANIAVIMPAYLSHQASQDRSATTRVPPYTTGAMVVYSIWAINQMKAKLETLTKEVSRKVQNPGWQPSDLEYGCLLPEVSNYDIH